MGDTTNHTVLLVDDSPVARRLMRHLLEKLACRVVEAEDGISGLARYRSSGPVDLIVADISMPGMSGTEMIRTLRRDDDGKRVPVIVTTATWSEHHADSLASLGVAGWVLKPVDAPLFQRAVSRLLNLEPPKPPKRADGA